jgi:glutaredoxin-related protein
MSEKIYTLIDEIDSGDNLAAQQTLENILQDKVEELLSATKQEVASSMFSTQECAECEEANEELKGGQHKIDVNKNGKLDAMDFKMLRKKKMKEAYSDPYAAKKAAEMKKKKDEAMTAAKKEYEASQEAKGKVNTKSFMKMKEEAEQVDEASYSAKMARAGKDIGKTGKMFSKIATKASRKYGKERGAKIAGAVLAKLRKKGK